MSQQGELKLQSEIEKRIGRLVEKANELIGTRYDKIKDNQIRNVLAVANTAPHVAVVTSFIRYQIGRSGVSDGWKNKDLGEKLIAAIDDLKNDAQSAKGEAKYGNVDDIQMQLTRLLLGFLNWHYVYVSNNKSSDKNPDSQQRQGGKS